MDGEQQNRTPQEPSRYTEFDPDDPIGSALRRFWAYLKETHVSCGPGDRLNFLANVAVIFVGTIAATIYVFQLGQMRAATSATQDAAKTAADTLRTDQRAWVTVSNMKRAGANIVVSFSNSGKTPAREFRIRIGGEAVPVNQKPFLGGEALLPGVGLIAPNGFFHVPLGANGYYDPKNTRLAIHGRVDYADIFGHPHWTTFCYYYFSPTKNQEGFAPCGEGNETDD